MLFDSTLGYIGWSWPLGLYVAWLNPGARGGFAWDYSIPSFLPVVYFSLATLMAYDAWSYWTHRWMHVNKTAFVWLHAKHHEHQAALDVRTSGYMSIYEGIFSDALPLLAIYALGSATGNWWYSFAGACGCGCFLGGGGPRGGRAWGAFPHWECHDR
jgi:sterol desaturase/sphingolipid hydroxylase (fatty acid hydroxylase superfamily)